MSLLNFITLFQAMVVGGQTTAAIDSVALTQGLQEALKVAVGNVLEVQRPSMVRADGPIYLSLGNISNATGKAPLPLTSLDSLPVKTFGERASARTRAQVSSARGGILGDGILVEVPQLSLQGELLTVKVRVTWTDQRRGSELRVNGFIEYTVNLLYHDSTRRFDFKGLSIGLRS